MIENKPIIIDGVDVSKCKKLDREYAPNYPEIGGYDWFNECKETSTDCEGRNCLFKQLAHKTQECEELKNKYSIQMSKNLEKQIKINNLLNKLSLKEFVLKVNGKKYTKFNGIDKAKIFINDENEIRNKKILELENQMSNLQWKFYNNCKEAENFKFKLKQAELKLKRIEKICKSIYSNGLDEEVDKFDDILQIIDEVE